MGRVRIPGGEGEDTRWEGNDTICEGEDTRGNMTIPYGRVRILDGRVMIQGGEDEGTRWEGDDTRWGG